MANTTGGGGLYFRRSNGSGITVTKLPGGFPVPTGPQQLQTAAKSALSMVKTIVQFLPVKGETATKSDINIIDRWFQSAGEDYTTFERLRNPDRLSWPGPGGFDVTSPSRKSLPYFEELCKAMSRVCEAYQWQGISDGSEIPNSMQRFGTALIPHIDAGLLHAVAVAGQGLLEELDPADINGRQLVEKLAGQDAHDNGNKDKLEATKAELKTGWPTLSPTDRDQLSFLKPLTTHQSADTSKNTEIVPTSRDALTQDLLNYQFNQRASGKTVEFINREFYIKNKSQLGKSEVDREKAFETVKRNARRCTQRT